MTRICVVPGDQAAPEAMAATVLVLREIIPNVEILVTDEGVGTAGEFGETLSDECREAIDSSDATLFGATSRRTGAISYLRWGKATYANIRPVSYIDGIKSPLTKPHNIDFVIVRENTEDLYAAVEGNLDLLRPLNLTSYRGTGIPLSGDGRFAVKVITRAATERIAHYAFQMARQRKQVGYPGKVTMSCKHNTLPTSDGFFREIVTEIAENYPDIKYNDFIIDDFARRIIVEPETLDVVLLPNQYGDILSDEASALVGGLGVAPSGCYGINYAYFEPVHGSAPDIEGLGIINPTATMLSAVMMLEYLGLPMEAATLTNAIRNVYADRENLPRDQGGNGSTEQFTRSVIARL
jgi:isocitrate/isopropylmalate dehydrogenase